FGEVHSGNGGLDRLGRSAIVGVGLGIPGFELTGSAVQKDHDAGFPLLLERLGSEADPLQKAHGAEAGEASPAEPQQVASRDEAFAVQPDGEQVVIDHGQSWQVLEGKRIGRSVEGRRSGDCLWRVTWKSTEKTSDASDEFRRVDEYPDDVLDGLIALRRRFEVIAVSLEFGLFGLAGEQTEECLPDQFIVLLDRLE